MFRFHPQQVAQKHKAHNVCKNPQKIRESKAPQSPVPNKPLGLPTHQTQRGGPPIAGGGQQHDEGHQQGQADSHRGGLVQGGAWHRWKAPNDSGLKKNERCGPLSTLVY